MSCHTRDGFKSTTRIAVALTGAERHEVEKHLHALRAEATGAALPDPTQEEIDAWYADIVGALDDSGLSQVRKDILAKALLRARFEQPAPDGRDFYVQRLLIARTMQQELIQNTPGLVGLAPPGSQSGQYELGEDGRPAKVWYSSFGSNMYGDRFACYTRGGSPNGGKTTYTGCRDASPPEASIPVALPGVVHYAGDSRVWSGGVAFLDTQAKGSSLGRAYKITAEQFDDVVYQESNSGGAPTGEKVDLNAAISHGRSVGKGVYGTLVHVGDYDGAPVFSFTGPFTVQQALRGDLSYTPESTLVQTSTRSAARAAQAAAKTREEANAKAEGRAVKPVPSDWPVYTSRPSEAYQAMIGGGLAETFGFSPAQVRVYFAGSTGVGATPRSAPSAAAAA